MSEFESEDIEEYIRSILQSIEKSMLKEKGLSKDYQTNGDIEFELAVVITEKGKGSRKLSVVNVRDGASRQYISKIRFKVREAEPTKITLRWENEKGEK